MSWKCSVHPDVGRRLCLETSQGPSDLNGLVFLSALTIVSAILVGMNSSSANGLAPSMATPAPASASGVMLLLGPDTF